MVRTAHAFPKRDLNRFIPFSFLQPILPVVNSLMIGAMASLRFPPAIVVGKAAACLPNREKKVYWFLKTIDSLTGAEWI